MDPDAKAYSTRLKNLVGDDDALEILSHTPSRIRALITGVDPATLLRKPSPDKWSIAAIVAHLADSELVFGYRLRMVLSTNGTPLQAFDPDRWASTCKYDSADATTSAELFARLRTDTLRMVRRVDPALLENTGIHEEWGTETARGLLSLEAGHDRNHLAQIEGILASLGAIRTFAPGEQKPEISFDDAANVDLRVGTIVDIVEVPDADRLMKLTVDFGADRRTVIAGIRDERSDPRILIGRQALFFYNLPKKKIRGQISEAMLCDVGYADGLLPALLQPEWPVPDGTRAG